MPGVYAPKALHDAEPTKHTQPFTGKGAWGFGKDAEIEQLKGFARTQSPQSVLKGIENKHFFEKTDFFYKLNAPTVAESVHFAYALINKQDLFSI